ncbi:MAG: aminotransferase class I/II-fold pyridoxal phosphate-dependent enzyme [Deltaproteobacteria bacterium]|nr:aminotransferase class I/II-fold pyridoxal phosphate-dependent enzyme [Deltaproteobacteria bacterium]
MRLNPLLGQLPSYPTVVLDRKKAELIAQGKPVYDFGTGDPTEPTPDFIRARVGASIPGNCRYPTVLGDRGVRAAFAGWASRRLGVDLDPDRQVLPSSGSKEVVFHMPLLVVDPRADDRAVVFPDPGYSVYYRGAVFAGGEAVPQRLEGDFVQRPWELPRELLRRTRLLWINSPHNPTGAVMSRDDLRRTWDVCREFDILLASDECYADTWFDRPPPSILEVASEGVVAVFSLSKRSGMTGYRTGMIAGDPRAIAALKDLRANPGLAPQDFVNAAAATAWADDAHAEERRAIFAAKRAVLVEFLRSRDFKIVASEASFYLWVRVPEGHDGQSYAEKLLAHGIVVNPGSAFAITDAGRDYIRLALVPDVETCREACGVWGRL